MGLQDRDWYQDELARKGARGPAPNTGESFSRQFRDARARHESRRSQSSPSVHRKRVTIWDFLVTVLAVIGAIDVVRLAVSFFK